MHLHAPSSSQAAPGRHSAAPTSYLDCLRSLPLETLVDALTDAAFDALLALLPAGLQAEAEGSDALDDRIAEHASRLAQAVLSTGACTQSTPMPARPRLETVERLWDRFWSVHPTHQDHHDARAEFFRLMLRRLAEDNFERDFWEGHEACIKAWRLGVAKPVSAFWWLRKQGWIDRYHGKDLKPILGDAELRRLKLESEQRNRVSAIVQLNAALPTLPAAEENLGPLDLAKRRLRTAQSVEEAESARAFILGIYGRKQLAAIEAELQLSRTNQ